VLVITQEFRQEKDGFSVGCLQQVLVLADVVIANLIERENFKLIGRVVLPVSDDMQVRQGCLVGHRGRRHLLSWDEMGLLVGHLGVTFMVELLRLCGSLLA